MEGSLDIDAPTWRRASPLLDAALDLPPQDRATWLEALPAQHADLKGTLSELLARAARIETHAQLVVHRDIKPSNLLVDAPGQVKLLDFGIARLLDDGRIDQPELTQQGHRVLTPDYAAPEQIAGLAVDTRCDVYALGVLLFELPTGARPYRLKRDSRAALEDAILAAEVPRPSDTVADPARRRALRGDLDTIVLKALKKPVAERYASVEALAEDIERHLSMRSVLARPDSAWYRSRRFVVRNRIAIATASVLLLTVLGGAGAALRQARIAISERQRAEDVRNFVAAIQGDGKIVVVGSAAFSTPTGGGTDFAVARYNPNGTLDTSFGSGGKLTTDIGGATDIARNVVLQGNGAILVSGQLTLGSSASLAHAGLARYDANGNPDGRFGNGGKLTLANLALGEALALQADGRILVAGSAPVNASSGFALMRFDANGSVDGGFGTAGLATTAFSTQDDFGRAVAVQADGRIVVAGQSSNRSNPDFAVARFSANGTSDASFGTGGKLTIDFFGSFDGAENAVMQPDGKIVLGGFARNGTRTGYGLARVNP